MSKQLQAHLNAIQSQKLKKQAILMLGLAGSVGKTLFASRVLEEIRRVEPLDAYVADTKHTALFSRFGQRGVDGRHNDPSIGVKLFDIRNPEERTVIGEALASQSRKIIIDFPYDSIAELLTMLDGAENFMEMFSYDDWQVTIPSVIADKKSLESFQFLKVTFPEARHIAVINKGLLKEKGLISLLPEIEREIGNGESMTINQLLTKNIIELVESRPFRDIYVPRDERINPDGGWFPLVDSPLTNRMDIMVVEGFIKETRDEINRLFP